MWEARQSHRAREREFDRFSPESLLRFRVKSQVFQLKDYLALGLKDILCMPAKAKVHVCLLY